jgi:chromosomal replication initiator protein
MDTIWEKIRSKLKNRLPSSAYNDYIKPLNFISYENDALIISAPDETHIQYVVDKYLEAIKELAFSLTSRRPEIKFQVIEPGSGETTRETYNEAPSTLNRALIFENFVVGGSNQFAHAAAIAVAKNIGKAYNPLFIYGGVGLGKTHLINAIGNYVFDHFPSMNIMLLTSETFVNEFINATAHLKMNEFRSKYRERCDILLIDDVQFLAGKERSQEEFFHTFNTLIDTKRQIVLTSDKYPHDIPNLEDRLRSRFESGLIVDIQPPDLETKIAILKRRVSEDGLNIDDSVLQYIASISDANIRDLIGYLNRVIAYANIKSMDIKLELAMEALKGLVKDKRSDVTVDDVIRVVADYFKIKSQDIKSERRTQSIALPRQIAMFIARTKLNCSYPELGEKFGGKDHSTIIHGVRKIEEKIKKDSQLKFMIDEIVKKIDNK